MLLKQNQQINRIVPDNQIKSVNLDIALLNRISKQTSFLKDYHKSDTSKVSLNQLSQILKDKNQKFTKHKHQKQQTRQWLKQKGVDFRKLNQEIKEIARVSSQTVPMAVPRISEPSALGVSSFRREQGQGAPQTQKQFGFTVENQIQFIRKQKQIALSRVIVKCLENVKPRSNTRAVLLNKIRGQKDIRQFSENLNKQIYGRQSLAGRQIQEENTKRKQQYFDFAAALATRGFDQTIHKLKGIKPFWKVVLAHIKTVQHYSPHLQKLNLQYQDHSRQFDAAQLRMNAFVMMKSLKLVQKQFQKSMPDTNKLNDWVREIQKGNRRLKVWRNYNGQPSWALAFLFFRAGKFNEMKRVLENVDRQYLEGFIKYQESVDKQQPQPSLSRYDIHKYKDSFFNQIIYILNGTPKFDPEIIQQQNLNKTWILLRTLGIYRNNQDIQRKYKQIKSKIREKQIQSDQPLTRQKLYDYLCLGFYRQLIQLFEKSNRTQRITNQSQFNLDDYFHLLTVLNYYPQLWGNASQEQTKLLQRRYSSVVLKYIQKLRAQGFGRQVPRYLLLTPPELIQDVALQFITTRQQFEQFDWKQIKDLILERDPKSGDVLYRHLALTVLDEMQLVTFEDYVFAADKYRSSFRNERDSVYKQQKCYVSILLKHSYFTHKKNYLIIRNDTSNDFQLQLYSFFGLQKTNGDLNTLVQRDRRIRSQVLRCQQLLDRQILQQFMHDERHLKNVIQPFQFYKQFKQVSRLMTDSHKNIRQLKDFKPTWHKVSAIDQRCQTILPVQNILRFLKFQFPAPAVSLYVFYLIQLINRTKIICNTQCDYRGIARYVYEIQKEINRLQAYYPPKAQKQSHKNRFVTKQEQQYVKQRQYPFQGCWQYSQFMKQIALYLKQYGSSSAQSNDYDEE